MRPVSCWPHGARRASADVDLDGHALREVRRPAVAVGEEAHEDIRARLEVEVCRLAGPWPDDSKVLRGLEVDRRRTLGRLLGAEERDRLVERRALGDRCGDQVVELLPGVCELDGLLAGGESVGLEGVLRSGDRPRGLRERSG